MPESSVTTPDDHMDRDHQLEVVIADYIRACETGTGPDRREFLERYPEIADDLREFFANRDQMDRLALPASVPSYDRSTFIRSEAGQGGLCIGAYTLMQKLGEGGMGEVWVAKQSEPVKRKVALKLIKRGMNSKEVLARFEQERQALAMMDHPSIAKVFDGGVTADGQPYFVMELVNGLSLTKYCDEARLTPRERMELFVPICQAVQHAHQKGIVHRDLKPSNILVTMYDGRPVPKVIDFGVAKATGGRLTDESMSTQVGAVVGTLEYMSPEQAGFSGQDIDTRADIYSLGVILYELLTGLRPIDGQRLRKAAFAEMIRIIQQEEPSKPSTRLSSDAGLPSLAALRQTEPKRLTALLRGELDWVVMKCLEKSRDRRYETANGLARDIQHYLADEPVEARPASTSYRVRKFLRRHKGPVLAASLVLLALIGGIIGTTGGLMLEARQRQIAEVNFKLARRHLYVARMHLAQVAWEDMRVSETIRLLDMYGTAVNNEGEPDDLKGFEWHYLNHLSHSYLVNLQGHSGDVFSVAFSPDGEKLASASRDQTVKVWDVASGRELTSKVHSSSVNGVVFSADGKWLASASGNFGQPGEVTVWDTVSGREALRLKGHAGPVNCVAFSPDGTRLASGSGNIGDPGELKMWDAVSGRETLKVHEFASPVTSVAFSPDGKRLASASNEGTVIVRDATSGQEILELKGHDHQIKGVAFSLDKKWLATASLDGTVRVWDAASGQETLTLQGHSSAFTSVAFSPDGEKLAAGGWDQTVKVWDTAIGQETLTLKGHTDEVTCVAFSPDGKWLASASLDQTVKVWDPISGQESHRLMGHNGIISSVAFSPDGKRLASASDDHSGSEDHSAKVWDITSGQQTLALKGHQDYVTSVVFSPDGKWLATASRDLTVKVWDALSGQTTLTLQGHTNAVNCVAFSPDGKRLASAGQDQTVKVWDTAIGPGTLTLKGHTDEVTCVAFSPDGKWLASASSDRTVKVWDAASGQEILTLKGHAGPASSVAFSPDGKRLASASGIYGKPGEAKVWDAASGRETLTLKGHASGVWSVAFSPDGKRLVTASDDQTVKLWDATSGEETLTLKRRNGGVTSVAFSPDGKRLASAGQGRIVDVWDARAWTPELKAEQQALCLIRFLRAKPLTKPAILDSIAADATISEPVRQRALELARDWPE